MAHISTGYPIGRPRNGEVRPLTKGGLESMKQRKRMKTEMGIDAYNQKMAIYQRLYLTNK